MTVQDKIRKEIKDCIETSIPVVPGYDFDHYGTIKRTHLYVNSQFEDSSEYMNRSKIFFNVVIPRLLAAQRLLNLDPKHIKIDPMNAKSRMATFLLEKELQLWLKRNKMSRLMNEIAEDVATYGSAMLKKTKSGAVLADLRRTFFDYSVKNSQDSPFLIFRHYFNEQQLMDKEGIWDAKGVDEAVNRLRQKSLEAESAPLRDLHAPSYEDELNAGAGYITVDERYGYVSDRELGGKTDKLVRALFIVADVGNVQVDEKGNVFDNSIVLFKAPWRKKWPVKDFHYSRVKGRWLGRGITEELFAIQERRNELANQKRISMEVSTIHLFQSADKTAVQNILTDLQSGDLIPTAVPGSIQPIANEERNLAAFDSEEKNYEAEADRITFMNELIRGEMIPGTTPATNAVIQNNNSQGVLAFKRENLAISFAEFFEEFVLEELLRDLTPEHILRFTGNPEELGVVDQAYVDSLFRDWMMEEVLNGRWPDEADRQQKRADFEMKVKKDGDIRFVNVKERFYDDVEMEFGIQVTDVQEDKATIANNMLEVFRAIAPNPEVLRDPVLRELLYSWAEINGVSPVKLEAAFNEKIRQESQMQNSALPLPQLPQMQMPTEPSPVDKALEAQTQRMNGG